jgi:hypothetical protein
MSCPRRVWISAAVLALSLVLSACGGRVTDDEAPSSPPLGALGSTTTVASGSSSTTTVVGSTTTTTAVGTKTLSCDAHPGVKCINIRSIAISGNSLVIDWDALNFTASMSSFHAHFFWDTFSPNQAGTNAAKFGATVGKWELTDQQPFRSQGEMQVANRPAAAKKVCVTVGDVNHALVDPTVFDCIAIPGA